MDDQTVLKHGGLGIASFVISVVILLLIVVLFGIAGVLKVSGGMNPAIQIVVGFAIILMWLVDLVGIGLGIAGAIDKKSKKTFPVLGIIIGVGIAVISVAVVVIGIRMGMKS